MLAQNATQIVLASSRVINPNLTETDFNNWYNTVLLPGFMEHQNASLGVRYRATNRHNVSASQYLAIYKTRSAPSSWSTEAVFSLAERTDAGIAKRDIGPEDVAIELSTWNPIQTFESLREKTGQIPPGRPKIVVVVKIEPRAEDEDGTELEDWYRKQHLDMLSMLPNYRRSTRYRSADGSKPRWLAIHEQDTPDIDPYAGQVMMNTEYWHKVFTGIKIFDATHWEYYFEAGNSTEKI
ncbi:hypothetical protein BDV96DRAFT_652890 [Lophiotrema nucula]|uniref:EthD domain-containing protein n=1 Tax=Lophiotrema nucula TaxID=690887 RepID=A0A6A5YMM2_9PLEO|nr:hypothetical protein BDV96DRAFT_652890 [Lophiotrema nucula]